MPYSALAFISILIFSCVHLWAEKIRELGVISSSRFLSTGSGVALAYVFVDLLPKLSKSDLLVKNKLWEFFPYMEHHVYVMALLGFILFFVVDRSKTLIKNESVYFWLSLGSYILFNFLVGYAVVDKDNPEVQPLILFTIAMTLHYFMNDYSLSLTHGKEYRYTGKWMLIAALLLGWIVGFWTELSETGVALISAFIGGGVIMNVTRHELPEENPHSLGAFLIASVIYTAILLTIGFHKLAYV
ncbi:MAG: hypothetical protein Q8K60_09195 [Parachlamydiaceae bacterium]|nr:hypothetical protein [Parachlamydiaceae bacterium]